MTDQKVSTITWTAVKNGDAKVVGQFTEITGGLFLDPADLSKLSGNLEANLSAIDSKNPVRDANISELLFGVVASKTTLGGIVIEAVAPEKTILAVGESTPATVSYSLGLPYGESAGEAAVTLSHPKEGRWAVSSTSPIALSLKGLSLTDQSAALRERCAHQSIGDGVQISFTLEFDTREAG